MPIKQTLRSLVLGGLTFLPNLASAQQVEKPETLVTSSTQKISENGKVPIASLDEIYGEGLPSHLTKDIRSTFYTLPQGAFIAAGIRWKGLANQGYPYSVLGGSDVFYINLHGAAGGKLSSNQGYVLSYQMVEKNGDPTKDEKGNSLPIPSAYLRKPSDWPKRGLNLNQYPDIEERNYAALAAEMNRRNPRWVIAEECNQSIEDPYYGATAKIIEDMLAFVPPEQRRFRYFVGNAPGTLGYTEALSNPLDLQTPGFQVVGNDPQINPQLTSAPQLYVIHRGENGEMNAIEDRGTFLLLRSGYQKEDLTEKQTAYLSKFAILQIGEAEFAYRMGQLFLNANPEGSASVHYARHANPSLAKAHDDFVADPKNNANPLNDNPRRFADFGNLLLKHAATVGTPDQFMSLVDSAPLETPLDFGPDKYACFISKLDSYSPVGYVVLNTKYATQVGSTIPANAISCMTTKRDAKGFLPPIPMTEHGARPPMDRKKQKAFSGPIREFRRKTL